MSLNLASIVHDSARFFPDEPALIHEERRWTYREFAARVSAFAAHLTGLGVQPGDKVALLAFNSPGYTIAYFGILHAGATVVPMSFLSVAREVAYTLEDSDAVALVADEELAAAAHDGFDDVGTCRSLVLFREGAEPLEATEGPAIDYDARRDPAPTRSDDTAVILYTSGTTGKPKGAELSHFNLFSNADYCCYQLLGSPRKLELFGPGNVALAALPLFHSFGQTTNQNAAIMGGAALVLLRRFTPDAALDAIEREKVTLFAGVPTMYIALLEAAKDGARDLASLRFCTSGGAAMPVEVMRSFEERYGVKILEGYGLSETSPVATFNVPWKERKPGSIGEPIRGCEARVVDAEDREVARGEVGEIVLRGRNIMKGYYNRPTATREAFRGGWFHTGDLARMDEDGYLWIVDRKKDLIIRGGFNVYPREVEEVLYGHAAVREAAVVGVPDDRYGEEVKAFVALDDANVTAEDIREYCRARLAASKYPRHVEILPELPKGSTGKILRKSLRESAREQP